MPLLRSAAAAIGRHLPIFVLMPLLIIVMTFPALAHIVDGSAFWLPSGRNDIYNLFWDAWHGKRVVLEGADYFYTESFFHPTGVSLAWHNHSLPHMVVLGLLGSVLPASSAFNLTWLLFIFAASLSAYVYLHYLFPDKWIAFFGAVVFGACPFVLSRPATPHISFIATIPLAMYFLHRAILEGRLPLALVSGALIGLTAFIGLYAFVCLVFTLLIYIVYFGQTRWESFRFWRLIGLLLLVAGAISFVRLYPMVADADLLGGALAKNPLDGETGTDLLGNFINYDHPLTAPLMKSLFNSGLIDGGWPQNVYLGYIALLLVALALARHQARCQLVLWLSLALVFLLLRLGSSLTVNNVEHEWIRLPKYFLERVFPPIFQPFWSTDPFYAGVPFPLAVLACYGLVALLRMVAPRRRAIVALFVAALVAFDYYQTPDAVELPQERLAYSDWLKSEPDQETIRLVNLPMGKQQSKHYDLHQSFDHYPQVEGRPTRAPDSAYDFIKGNSALAAWRDGASAHCLPTGRAGFEAAIDELREAGFSHIVRHKWLRDADAIAHGFVSAAPAYEDDYAAVYRLDELRQICENAGIKSLEALPHFRALALSDQIAPESHSLALSLHPAAPVETELFAFYSSVFNGYRDLVHLYAEAGEIRVQSENEALVNLESIEAGLQLIWQVHQPAEGDAAALPGYLDWRGRYFRPCQTPLDSDEAAIRLFIREDFACELAAFDAPWRIRYDNGFMLANLLLLQQDRQIGIQYWWSERTDAAYSISIQIVDDEGQRAFSQDHVVGIAALERFEYDLSGLAPGEYAVNMIHYDYETGRSVPGSLADGERRFERMLEIARLKLE